MFSAPTKAFLRFVESRKRSISLLCRGSGRKAAAHFSWNRFRLLHTEGFRICAIFVAVFALAMAVLASSVLFIVNEEFRDQIVQFAQADIAAVRDGYRMEGTSEAVEVIGQRMAAPGASDFFLLERGRDRLAGNLAPMPAREGVVALAYPGPDQRHAILGIGAFLAPGLYVFSGSDLFHARLARQRIVATLIWVFAAGLVLAGVGGTLVSRNFLRRTDAIASTCRAIMDGNLKTRIPVRGAQDEMDRLAETINRMLDRIAGLMENLHQVTNDIAHDLRTPVTHLRHRLERARSQAATVQDYEQALEAAIAASDEILALFTALLRIAQIEGGARRSAFAPVELAPLLRHLQDVFGPVAEDSGHSLSIRLEAMATVRGDRDLLVQLFSNLIENAIVHTPGGTAICVVLALTDGRGTVTVSDNGPGVPLEEHANLFRRLYRREASRTRPGYGLGLALVAAIAELHGASIGIDRRTGAGFAIGLSFPVTDNRPPDP
jgi:signal transduction histidine kinase